MTTKPTVEEARELVGKTCYLELNNRNETEWNGCKIVSVTERAVSVEYTTRNVRHFDVLPWHSIAYLSVRFSNGEAAVTETQSA